MIRGSRRPLRIAITTGDVDGVGLEVSIKALAKIGSQKGVCFYLWRAPNCSSADLRRIDRHFKRLTVSSWPEALKQAPDSSRQIIDISSNLPPSVWVETTAQASFFGHLDAMVTAPLSKTAIALSGMTDMGHTGILKRVTKSKELFMGFIGDKFNVLLATGHIPIDEVTSQLSTSRLELAVKAANNMRIVLDKRQAAKPLALLGLNPHAGEAGLIGSIEKNVHSVVIDNLREKKFKIEGPLVPDAAFFRENWAKYSVYIASYHDQGLIPFKMIHGQESGIHVTLGLPFVRTSVDHGTAKDIFGKNKADPRSMTLAIEWALRLCRSEANLSLK